MQVEEFSALPLRLVSVLTSLSEQPALELHYLYCTFASMTWDGETYSLTVIGSGVSGIVYSLDDVTVVKVPFNIPQCVQAFEIEREVYRRIAKYSCPYIVKCYDFTHPHGIILEKLENTVRNYI
jgi:hypothetical protein